VDAVDLIVWGMAAVALAGGMRSALRQKPPEDLTRQIFPDEP
jgi:3-oxoacyl-(acyl-carrier-protein) synthase